MQDPNLVSLDLVIRLLVFNLVLRMGAGSNASPNSLILF
jgi:hypothetical protein